MYQSAKITPAGDESDGVSSMRGPDRIIYVGRWELREEGATRGRHGASSSVRLAQLIRRSPLASLLRLAGTGLPNQ
jgi:hypothetical protein